MASTTWPSIWPGVGVAEAAIVVELFDLAHVVQKRADHDQIEIDFRIAIGDPHGDFHQVHDVLQQSARIRMMVFHAGRRAAEAIHEIFVGQKAFGQIAQMRIGQFAEQFGQPDGQPIDFGRRKGHEIGQFDFFRPGLANAGGDQLQRALIDLRGPFDADEIAVVEAAMVGLARVPHPRGKRAAAIGQLDLQIEIAVAVRPQLLLRGEENLID